ncbi:MAG: hypothetical protein MMC23_009210 [Stictis urceolatum]|nr:hypothetical protein [Stictis urceolata]
MPSSVPTETLSLNEFPTITGVTKRKNLPQGIEVSLTGDTKIHNLVKGIQSARSAQVSLSKKSAFIIDGIIYPCQTVSRESCLLYQKPASSSNIQLRASLSLNDATATRATVAAMLNEDDPAILALQEDLANLKRQKESNTTVFVKDNSKLPPAKSGKQALKGNLAFLKNHRRLLPGAKATTRSMPASPSLGGLTPNSQRPDMKTLKQDALKTTLIHLLAAKPYSKQEVLDILKCTTAEISPLLEKWQGKMEDSKFTLSDRGYKELDVWKFAYRDQNDRQDAIDRAIKAYDRQRISVRENIWQMLLPREQRGKGKILSKLELHKGPVDRVRTPQINVESTTAGARASHSASDDSETQKDRLGPNAAKSGIRSSSQDPINKKRISEKEAQSKRLFAKDPKKAAQAAKAKESKPSQTTTSGKAAPKKPVPAANSKVKSAEYVHDSDEDIDMVDVLSPEPRKKASPKQVPSSASTTSLSTKPTAKVAEPSKKLTTQKLTVKKEIRKEPKSVTQPRANRVVKPTAAGKSVVKKDGLTSSISKSGAIDSDPTSVPMARSLSHKRSNSSPMKPSPLGSSPPTNASDMDNDYAVKSSKSSSSSNSPLINHRHEMIARKAPARTSAPAVENPDRGLKRKANDLDSNIHHHGGNVETSSYERPSKRHMSSSASSTRSDSPDDAMSLLSEKNIEDSQRFMRQWHIYVKNLKELKAMKHPPRDKVEKLHRMHKKLAEHKSQIWELAKKTG